jgi:KipI family sensor histidine kinase inhibitor
MSEAGSTFPRFLDAGEAALVVEFGDRVDAELNNRVLSLDASISDLALSGVRETVPTYRSLMVHYDPLSVERDALIEIIAGLVEDQQAPRRALSRWTVPCCYEGVFGEDLAQIADLSGLSIGRVVELHVQATYRVYMYGFAPGFCYLGGTPEVLAISRRASPRPPTPPNVVLLAGGLSLISTVSMPTGWWIIGTTPERMFAPERERAFLAEVGDFVEFDPIDKATFDALKSRAGAGEIVAVCNRIV